MSITERRAIRDRLKNILDQAQRQRHQREELVGGMHGSEPGWARYERHVMLGAVNAERSSLSKAPIGIVEVQAMDNAAAGHSDYTNKFCLYCTELVVDRP